MGFYQKYLFHTVSMCSVYYTFILYQHGGFLLSWDALVIAPLPFPGTAITVQSLVITEHHCTKLHIFAHDCKSQHTTSGPNNVNCSIML